MKKQLRLAAERAFDMDRWWGDEKVTNQRTFDLLNQWAHAYCTYSGEEASWLLLFAAETV